MRRPLSCPRTWRTARPRRRLDGQADEDPTGPDRLEIVRRVLARQGCALWLELRFDGPDALPGLPAADSAEALRAGSGANRQPGPGRWAGLSPAESRGPRSDEAAGDAGTCRSSRRVSPAGGGGLVIRLGPGPTLLGTPDTGLDDATYQKFTHDTFGPETAREQSRAWRAPIPTGSRCDRRIWRA